MPAALPMPINPDQGAAALLDRLRSDRVLQTRLAGAAGIVVLGLTASDGEGGIVLCPYRRCTGGYCPLCGATRSFGRLLRGDVVGAWLRHPLIVLLAVQAAIIGAFAFSGQPTLAFWRQSRLKNRLLAANAFVGVALWVGRLAIGDIPAPNTLSFFGL